MAVLQVPMTRENIPVSLRNATSFKQMPSSKQRWCSSKRITSSDQWQADANSPLLAHSCQGSQASKWIPPNWSLLSLALTTFFLISAGFCILVICSPKVPGPSAEQTRGQVSFLQLSLWHELPVDGWKEWQHKLQWCSSGSGNSASCHHCS